MPLSSWTVIVSLMVVEPIEILLDPETVKSFRVTLAEPAPVMLALTPLLMMRGKLPVRLVPIPTTAVKVELTTGLPVRLTLPPMIGVPAVVPDPLLPDGGGLTVRCLPGR